jgi:hypothetical protein
MTTYYKQFITRENAINELFGREKFPEDIRKLSEEQVEDVKKFMEAALSPENLYRDGEATQKQVDDTLEFFHMLCREINANTPHSFEISELSI